MRIAPYLLATALGIGLTDCANLGNYCAEHAWVCVAAGAVVVVGTIVAAASGHHNSDSSDNGSPSGLPSDSRLKRDIRFAGTLGNGVHIYTFRYWNDERTFAGVLAQDLLKDPRFRDAVHQSASGFYVVDLRALNLEMAGSPEQYIQAGQHALKAAESVREGLTGKGP
jgi:hypothetical protein